MGRTKLGQIDSKPSFSLHLLSNFTNYMHKFHFFAHLRPILHTKSKCAKICAENSMQGVGTPK